MLLTSIFTFSHIVLYPVHTNPNILETFVICLCFPFGRGQNLVVWLGVNPLPHNPIFKWPWKRSRLKALGENQKLHFLLFTQCFEPWPKTKIIILANLFCSLQMLSIWTSLEFCCLVKSASHSSICSCPTWVAQRWVCQTHDLVVVCLIPGWGEFSFRRIFASHLCRNMWEKSLVALERKIVLVLVWKSQETHVLHWPPWYDLSC